jgi:hypothetical protein
MNWAPLTKPCTQLKTRSWELTGKEKNGQTTRSSRYKNFGKPEKEKKRTKRISPVSTNSPTSWQKKNFNEALFVFSFLQVENEWNNWSTRHEGQKCRCLQLLRSESHAYLMNVGVRVCARRVTTLALFFYVHGERTELTACGKRQRQRNKVL